MHIFSNAAIHAIFAHLVSYYYSRFYESIVALETLQGEWHSVTQDWNVPGSNHTNELSLVFELNIIERLLVYRTINASKGAMNKQN